MVTKKLPAWLQKSLDRKKTAGWSEADYSERGIGTIKVRLPLRTLEMLEELAQETGPSRQGVIQRLIEAEHERLKKER